MDAKNIIRMFIQEHRQLQKAEEKRVAKLQKAQEKQAAKNAVKLQKAKDKELQVKTKQYAKLTTAAITAAAHMWVKELSLQKEQLKQTRIQKAQEKEVAKVQKAQEKEVAKVQKAQEKKATKVQKAQEKKAAILQKQSEKALTGVQMLFKKKRATTNKHKVVIVQCKRRPIPTMEGIADFMRK